MSARGQLGQTLVFSKWKGRAYAKQYTVPSNPNSTAQQATRNPFKFLNSLWPFMPSTTLGGWNLYAVNNQFTNRNGFIKQNLSPIIGQTDIALLTVSPAAGGGLASLGTSFTAASAAVNVSITPPVLPAGWTIDASYAVAIENVNPTAGVLADVGSGTDVTDPYEPNITGLKASTAYLVGAWFEYTKSNGDKAYGVNDTQLVTTLA